MSSCLATAPSVYEGRRQASPHHSERGEDTTGTAEKRGKANKRRQQALWEGKEYGQAAHPASEANAASQPRSTEAEVRIEFVLFPQISQLCQVQRIPQFLRVTTAGGTEYSAQPASSALPQPARVRSDSNRT